MPDIERPPTAFRASPASCPDRWNGIRDGAEMTEMPVLSNPSLWRRATAAYAKLLEILLAACVGILVIPVTLQIISRYTPFIPSYIWTEEMARFLFVWTIMIGAMVGIRESQHFEVDVWPDLSRRSEAMVRILARIGVLAMAANTIHVTPATGHATWISQSGRSASSEVRFQANRVNSIPAQTNTTVIHGGCGEPVENLHRCPDQGGVRPLVLHRHHA